MLCSADLSIACGLLCFIHRHLGTRNHGLLYEVSRCFGGMLRGLLRVWVYASGWCCSDVGNAAVILRFCNTVRDEGCSWCEIILWNWETGQVGLRPKLQTACFYWNEHADKGDENKEKSMETVKGNPPKGYGVHWVWGGIDFFATFSGARGRMKSGERRSSEENVVAWFVP